VLAAVWQGDWESAGVRGFRLSAQERGEEMGWPLSGLEWRVLFFF